MTTQPTIYTYFRGGGGADLGAEQAGYRSIGGVELDPQIATVCDRNFPNAPTTVADVCDVDPALLLDTAPDWFHASPSCKNASQAKAAELDEDGATMPRETEQDRQAGAAVARFISHWKPSLVTIENVWQYRTFEAFERIREALREAGYSYEYWHLNAADYGVPQTRKRLILKARKGLCFVQRPSPTHRQGGDMFHAAWRGWYEATHDIFTELTHKKTIPQWAASLAHAAKQKSKSFLIGHDSGFGTGFVLDTEPSMTIRSGSRGKMTIVDDSAVLTPSPKWHARIQSLPDSYLLPDGITLACTVIGNMVPPLLMERVIV